MVQMTSDRLAALLFQALTRAGFSDVHATALARQTVLAEELGQSNVGAAHVFDYVNGARDGRIDPLAVPEVSRPAPTQVLVDGNGGLPQTGFDLVFEDVVQVARQQGMALFISRNACLCGSLGTFALRLAERGLMALAATNGSPLLAVPGSTQATYCTNPIAFAAPAGTGSPLLIDQSCSATAYVNIRAAAERGEPIPAGWAVDREGNPTTDASAALDGAMLAFGGARGANLALLVEILAAGVGNAHWSIDAAPFDRGAQCPATGLSVIAINADAAAPGFAERIGSYLDRLAGEFRVHVPGRAKAGHRLAAEREGLSIPREVILQLEALASGTAT